MIDHRDARQAARQIRLYLEDGNRERLSVAITLLDPGVVCPACGSPDHDGWTNHQDCPEDWSQPKYTEFEWRRYLQLATERGVSEAVRQHETETGKP